MQRPQHDSGEMQDAQHGYYEKADFSANSKRTVPPKVLPKALPDTDDQSMSHVFEYIQQYEQDLYWSFLSDSFFIVGGVMYVLLSVWDVLGQQQGTHLYKAMDVLAPVVYVFNSAVDVEWAYRVKERMGVKKAMSTTWQDWRMLLDIHEEDVDEPQANANNWYHRLRKHGAHRRSIIAALTFGFAAVFGVISVLVALCDENNTRLTDTLDYVSVYSYIVSAIFSCSGKRNRPWLQTSDSNPLKDPETLEDLGDLLFLIGSLVDGALCTLSFDDDNPGWGLLSSCLWCCDACLYLRSDIIMHGRLQQRNLEGTDLV